MRAFRVLMVSVRVNNYTASRGIAHKILWSSPTWRRRRSSSWFGWEWVPRTQLQAYRRWEQWSSGRRRRQTHWGPRRCSSSSRCRGTCSRSCWGLNWGESNQSRNSGFSPRIRCRCTKRSLERLHRRSRDSNRKRGVYGSVAIAGFVTRNGSTSLEAVVAMGNGD